MVHVNGNCRFRPDSLTALVVSMGLALAQLPAQACGYHNPIALARGAMNWAYPDSLHVQTAVWQAEDAGLLPKRQTDQTNDLFALNRVSLNIKKFVEVLAGVPGGEELPEMTIVLIDSMLWSRIVSTPKSREVRVHVDGTTPGLPVMVTDGKVINAMVTGILEGRVALQHGLIKLYGASGLDVLTMRINEITHF